MKKANTHVNPPPNRSAVRTPSSDTRGSHGTQHRLVSAAERKLPMGQMDGQHPHHGHLPLHEGEALALEHHGPAGHMGLVPNGRCHRRMLENSACGMGHGMHRHFSCHPRHPSQEVVPLRLHQHLCDCHIAGLAPLRHAFSLEHPIVQQPSGRSRRTRIRLELLPSLAASDGKANGKVLPLETASCGVIGPADSFSAILAVAHWISRRAFAHKLLAISNSTKEAAPCQMAICHRRIRVPSTCLCPVWAQCRFCRRAVPHLPLRMVALHRTAVLWMGKRCHASPLHGCASPHAFL